MESLVRKCLLKREERFEINSCPTWLLSILPARIKSVETNVYSDNEQQSTVEIDLSPYKLTSRIPLLNNLNFEINNEKSNEFEYPIKLDAFNNQQLNNSYQLICSASNQQLILLFKKMKDFQMKRLKNNVISKTNFCHEENCSNRSIPLSLFCINHLFQYDTKQILFVKCEICQQITLKDNLNHFIPLCCYKN